VQAVVVRRALEAAVLCGGLAEDTHCLRLYFGEAPEPKRRVSR
jgi:hypothetical protein